MLDFGESFADAVWTSPIWVAALVVFQAGIVLRVIMRRLPVGETLAWTFIVAAVPLLGPLTYLLIGELRIGSRRARRVRELYGPIRAWLDDLKHARGELADDDGGAPFSRLAEKSLGLPPMKGGSLRLLEDWHAAFDAIISEIESAKQSCHLEFYIWNDGGRADDVAAALIAAADRGVKCRVLLDALGSRDFLRGPTTERLRAAGIELIAALPGGIFRALFVRFDLRLHRKIVVIDGKVAFTGSMNLVDPRYFKQGAGVGEWVDAMVRVEGPPAEALGITFLADWFVESDQSLAQLKSSGAVRPLEPVGEALVQTAPSGPANPDKAIERALVSAVYAARREIILTSPYFVPNEPLQTALVSAAERGVRVVLIIPEHVDSKLVRYASRAFMGELVAAGVEVMQFHGGLLHTKSVAVDGEWSLFGSLNLDPRSLHLNFEVTLGVFDRPFTQSLRNLQMKYLESSHQLTAERLAERSSLEHLAESMARLLGPLL